MFEITRAQSWREIGRDGLTAISSITGFFLVGGLIMNETGIVDRIQEKAAALFFCMNGFLFSSTGYLATKETFRRYGDDIDKKHWMVACVQIGCSIALYPMAACFACRKMEYEINCGGAEELGRILTGWTGSLFLATCWIYYIYKDHQSHLHERRQRLLQRIPDEPATSNMAAMEMT